MCLKKETSQTIIHSKSFICLGQNLVVTLTLFQPSFPNLNSLKEIHFLSCASNEGKKNKNLRSMNKQVCYLHPYPEGFMPLIPALESFFLFSISPCHGCFSVSHQEEQMIMGLGCHDNRKKIRIDRLYLIEWLLISPKGKTSKLQLFS